jgi:hypothetical protein
MENKKESYDEKRAVAKKFYKTIGSVWCPVLDDYIVFNKRGFRHLIGKNGFTRPKNEQLRRFHMLSYVQDILGNPNAILNRKSRESKGLTTDLWIFMADRENLHIKVVVRRAGKGKKHFLSIYGKIQKSTP